MSMPMMIANERDRRVFIGLIVIIVTIVKIANIDEIIDGTKIGDFFEFCK